MLLFINIGTAKDRLAVGVSSIMGSYGSVVLRKPSIFVSCYATKLSWLIDKARDGVPIEQQTGFESSGVGYFCYQEYPYALGGSKQDAEHSAQKFCSSRRAVRVSQWKCKNYSLNCHVDCSASFQCD